MEIKRSRLAAFGPGTGRLVHGHGPHRSALSGAGSSPRTGRQRDVRAGRARTAWQTHPLGQILIVTAGCGWAQRDGGPVEEIRPGDVVWIQAGEKH